MYRFCLIAFIPYLKINGLHGQYYDNLLFEFFSQYFS